MKSTTARLMINALVLVCSVRVLAKMTMTKALLPHMKTIKDVCRLTTVIVSVVRAVDVMLLVSLPVTLPAVENSMD